VIGNATSFAPTLPVYGTPGSFYQYSDPLGPDNPLGELALINDGGTTYRGIGSVQGRYTLPFFEALSVTSDLSFDVANANRTTFTPSTEQSQVETSSGGTFNRATSTQLNNLFDVYGNYVKGLGWMASSLDLTAGYSYESQHGDYPTLFAQHLSSDLLGVNGVPSATLERTTVFVDDSRLISFFGRSNFSIRDRYLFSGSVRRDGSSKFGPEHQWGIFPAAAFAWRVSDEPFMQRFGTLSDLKLRVSWGVNGNQAFPNYRAFSDYLIGGPQAQVQLGNEFITTIRPSAADPDIHWERTASTNVGLDYGLWNNRVTGTIDAYTKKTTDLIFNVPIAAGTNLSNFLTTNIGSMQNRGVELGLNVAVARTTTHGFAWDASFNAATNRNRLLQINAVGTGSEQILVGGIAGGVGSNIEVLQPGYPVNSFLVYQHKRDASGNPIYADVNGDKTIDDQDLYVDQNGDKIINQSDRRIFHDPAPKWILGHTSLMSYGNFDFSTTIRAYLGNYVYNNVASNLGNYNALSGANPVNVSTSVLSTGFVKPQYFSDVYVEDGSFLRMDNLTLGYTIRTLPQVGQVRVFGTVQNVFTTTSYTGVDPTAGVNGIDNNIYPRSRTFVAGANLVF
jgi:TonB-dependent starch-binding outer membrane protein SusC